MFKKMIVCPERKMDMVDEEFFMCIIPGRPFEFMGDIIYFLG